MNVTQRGIDIIKEFEGCKLTAYLCPAGKWTVGYGQTGSKIVEGVKWAQWQADEALAHHCEGLADHITKRLRVPVTQCQFDALVCFVYNVGIGAFETSTMLRLLNGGDYVGASGQFGRWLNKGSTFEAGFRRRREAERQLFTCAC